MTDTERGLTPCVCLGDRKPGTKRCTRWADPERGDGLCKACALPDAYCREFREVLTAPARVLPTTKED